MFSKVEASAEKRTKDSNGGHQGALKDACFYSELAYEYTKTLSTLLKYSPVGSIRLGRLKTLLASCSIGLHAATLLQQAFDGYFTNASRGAILTLQEQLLWSRALHKFLSWLDYVGRVNVQHIIKRCWGELSASKCLQVEPLRKVMALGIKCLSRAYSEHLNLNASDKEEDIWLAFGAALHATVQYVQLADTENKTYLDMVTKDVLSSVDCLTCIVETLHFIGAAEYCEPQGDTYELDKRKNMFLNDNTGFLAITLSRICRELPEKSSVRSPELGKALEFAASAPVQEKVVAGCHRLLEKAKSVILTPEDRVELYTLAYNAAAMFSVYYIEDTPGCAAYLMQPALEGACVMADAWILYMEQVPACVYKPGLSLEMALFAKCPAIYFKTVRSKFEMGGTTRFYLRTMVKFPLAIS